MFKSTLFVMQRSREDHVQCYTGKLDVNFESCDTEYFSV